MKKAIIIHCWEGYPDYCWYPQTKKELEANGFEVIVPEMPETTLPKLSLWLPKLTEIVSNPGESIYLIGHSVGVITILRYLETLKDSDKIGGVVFVAGFTDDLGFKELNNFFENPVDFEKIKSKAKYYTAIHSDNDPYVDLRYSKIFKEKLDAKIIIKHNMKHFSGSIDDEESCTSLPEVTQSVLEMVDKKS